MSVEYPAQGGKPATSSSTNAPQDGAKVNKDNKDNKNKKKKKKAVTFSTGPPPEASNASSSGGSSSDPNPRDAVKNVKKKPARLTKAPPPQAPNATPSAGEAKSKQSPKEREDHQVLLDFLMRLPGASERGLGYQSW